MSQQIACRGCDGAGKPNKREIGVFGVVESPNKCSRCSGSGVEPGIARGRGRKPPHVEEDESEMTLEQLTRQFLRSRGH